MDYDHEAFLGEDAKTFDKLKPDESKARLGQMFDKIDTDDDGKVSHQELRAWIQKSQKTYIVEDVERQWKAHNPDLKDVLSWGEYKQATYGFIDELTDANDDDSKTYKEMMRRDKRRWTLADRNGDNSLSKEEFTDFLHPEESDRMRGVIVEETLEDIDKDNDGKLSLSEYISDIYSQDAAGDEIPEWVAREREQFKTHRDANGDGFMDKDEIREWIAPPDYDHSDAEAKHLVLESDADKDGKLSKQEVLDNYDLFVGSQATDFGEALVNNHDEF